MNKYIYFILLTLNLVSNCFILQPNYNIGKYNKNIFKNTKIPLRLYNNNINNDNDNNKDNDNDNKIKSLRITPIKKIEYDDIFNNIKNITHAFLSSNIDRVVIFFNNKKGVYYFNNTNDFKVIDVIFKSYNINMKIITYYIREMDCYDGSLYCEPRYEKNSTNIKIDNINETKYKLDMIYNYYSNDIINNNNLKNKTKPILVKQIKKINYDDIIYNIKNISYIFLSGNYDRIVIYYNNERGVYYFNNIKEFQRIEYMLKLNNKKIKIIKDFVRIMDTYNGLLYCTPKYDNNYIDYYDNDNTNDNNDDDENYYLF